MKMLKIDQIAMSMAERVKRADYVIENDGTLSDLYGQLDNLILRIEPTTIRTLIEYFPPLGAVSATAVYLTKRWRAKNQVKSDV